ncbi:enoyl-CoA hydratase [Fluviicoccus keumensis]|uniref:Enoyl-CoA hydratase n=1 Tax=Fluviicoccus keumensis TaxID=1435465 RepID=A0A4Q7Z4Q7_9GAMM|nr:crotonase/enoyl-CoA hydratase family protein [Fluviicoccus keumensis]RZU45340.1 enoyl-CoA hydratase [Fluviicoccus keumensis]
MNTSVVDCKLDNGICTIVMADGGRNLISPTMIAALNKALDQAEQAGAVVLLTGSGDTFSAGFDLKILKRGNRDTIAMLTGGFKLAERLLSFPRPVVVACNGHALAMGAFLLLAGDYRIGRSGSFRIATNEVEIGLTMPAAGVELCRQRLTPAHFNCAVLLSELYSPETAVEAGFLDAAVPLEQLMPAARAMAERCTKLDGTAYINTKERARGETLRQIRKFIQTDRVGFLMEGARRLMGKRS